MGLGRGRRVLSALCAGIATLAASPFCAAAEPVEPDPWLGRDKLYHFGATALISAGGYGLGKATIGGYAGPALLGSSLALAVGATKELLDLAGLGNPSWRDFTWDVIGTAVGTGLCLSIDALVHSGSASAPAHVTVAPTAGGKGFVVTFPFSL